MKTDLERMYLAARKEMPAAAEDLSTVVTNLLDSIETLNTQSAKAGDPQVLRSMLRVGGDVHDTLRKAVSTLHDAATALELTADDFVATDEQARTDLNQIDQRVLDLPEPDSTEHDPPPSAGTPEAEGAPGTPSTGDPVDPQEDRSDRDNPGVDPTARWGR